LHARKVNRRQRLSNELDSVWRRSLLTAKSMKRAKKIASVENKNSRQAKNRRPSGIRETEEARTLLQHQLHGLYWWIFNACRIKGFVRAKALNESETEQGETVVSGAASESAASSKDQLP
jgi:hypothetical protein